jgi:hypothetical protein
VLPGARRQVAAKDHAEFINNMELIDTMPPPGLYEILITEKPANPSASEAPDFELCIEPRSLDDIRALGCNSPEDKREFAAVARVSELNNALYATYLQPWITAMSSPQLARVALKLNPLRLSYSLLSDTNPMMRAVVPLAEKARAERTVPDADNPFVAMQQQFSKAMIDALNLYRDARDQLTEQIGMTGRIIGMHTFGASAPLKALQKKFGFEPSHVVTAAKERLAIGEAARVLRVDKIRDLRGA